MPFTDCCRKPSEAEPYSPEIAQLAPLADCGRVNVPADVADLPPVPNENSCRVIGEAVSRTEPETVSMTRSPAVNDVIGLAKAIVIEQAKVTVAKSALLNACFTFISR